MTARCVRGWRTRLRSRRRLTVSLLLKTVPYLPQQLEFFYRSLPVDTLSALVENARGQGTTIFGVQWAAMHLALLYTNPPTDSNNINNPFLIAPINLRPLAANPKDRSQWKVRLSIAFLPYVARDLHRFVRRPRENGRQQGTQDIWNLAREVRQEIEGQKPYLERAKYWVQDIMATALKGFISTIKPGSATIPHNGIPYLSSMGVVDPYLASSHPIGSSGESLIISHPRLTVRVYDSFLGFSYAIHSFSWKGELYFSFGFVETVMGKAVDQEMAVRSGKTGTASALEFYNRYLELLSLAAQKRDF